MSRWIDAEKEIAELKTMKVEGETFTTAVNFAIITLEQAPSIDLVRCGECIHFTKLGDGWGRCNTYNKTTQTIDFCSYGKRKESE